MQWIVQTRNQQTFFSADSQIVNILGFAGHIRSLSHILLLFAGFENVKIILSSQAKQEQVMGQGCLTPGLEN